jgi:hypothetical protein
MTMALRLAAHRCAAAGGPSPSRQALLAQVL